MIKIASILAATSLVAALAASPAEAHWNGGGHQGGFHHSHNGYWGHHWGYWHGDRPWGYRVVYSRGVCPPGTHPDFWGHYCYANF